MAKKQTKKETKKQTKKEKIDKSKKFDQSSQKTWCSSI